MTIVTMTASSSENSNFLQPIEPEQSRLTYDHVTASLQQVTRDASEGDFVYIHYSGHGKQVEPIVTDNRQERDKGDLALVPVGTARGNSYLRGRELAHHLSLTVKRNLRVTMVLDCCFSGCVPRQGSTNDVVVRAVDHQVSTDSAMSQEFRTGIAYPHGTPPFRNARIVSEWLINPEEYTILAASGPHDRAFELVKAGKRYFALTYFLYRALTSLRKSGMGYRSNPHTSIYVSGFTSIIHSKVPCATEIPRSFFLGGLESTSPSKIV